MKNNIEFSKEWLVKKIIEEDFKEKRTGKEKYINIKYKDLLKLVLNFIKLNERGD